MDNSDKKTVGVVLSDKEREEIKAAAEKISVGVSTFMRMKALEAARGSSVR